mmetsp:Transcript_15287/g.23157  ORF Transcript_15287/g.23157 Transcript_15287/m.23157 type:complete len:227 (+) Transcript_15287:78-758(+)
MEESKSYKGRRKNTMSTDIGARIRRHGSKNFMEVKVTLLGGEAVGKTALGVRLTTGNFTEDHDNTVEDSYRAKLKVDGRPYVMEIFDTAGHPDLQKSMYDCWITTGSAYIIIYSISDRKSFNFAVKAQKNIADANKGKNIPIIFVANKIDLENRIVKEKEGRSLAKRCKCPYFEVSVKNKISHKEPFREIIRMFDKERKEKREAFRKASHPDLKPKRIRRFFCTIL